MKKTTREMRVVLKYYLNNPLQFLFNEKPKILSSKNYLLAHWSPQWPNSELHRIGGRKSEYLVLSSIFLVLAFTKPLKVFLCHKMSLYFHLLSRHFHLDIVNLSVRLGKIKKAFHELHWLHCFNHYWPQLALMASQPTNLTLFVGIGLTQKTTLVNPFPTKLESTQFLQI